MVVRTASGGLINSERRKHPGPGAKPIPENRFVPKERILHPRLELVAGLLLPAAPAERPHVRDRAISRARPRPTPRHPRGLGRTTLGVRQAKRPRAQVFSEDPILLPEIVDQIVLVTVHPASEREDEELQRRRHSLRLLGRLDQHRPSLGRFFAPYAVTAADLGKS